MVYAEVIEYLKGLPDFTHRKKQLQVLLREVYPYFLTYAILERYADIRRTMRPPHGAGLIWFLWSNILGHSIVTLWFCQNPNCL